MVIALCYGHKICKFESCTRILYNVIEITLSSINEKNNNKLIINKNNIIIIVIGFLSIN